MLFEKRIPSIQVLPDNVFKGPGVLLLLLVFIHVAVGDGVGARGRARRRGRCGGTGIHHVKIGTKFNVKLHYDETYLKNESSPVLLLLLLLRSAAALGAAFLLRATPLIRPRLEIKKNTLDY